MAKLLREAAFVLSISLLLVSNPNIRLTSGTQVHRQAGALALQATSSAMLIPAVTCPPPPRDCW
jgi:hypothetical protein